MMNVSLIIFLPQRGLCQGDPLSPFLFLLCSEGLTAVLLDGVNKGVIHGCKISKSAPEIPHLLFVDDSYFFLNATTDKAVALKDYFDIYVEASGQIINYDKSSLLCSPNVSDNLREAVLHVLGVRGVEDHGTYLGLPSIIRSSNQGLFNFIREGTLEKISARNSKKMAQSGKEVTIEAVAQALPTYAMNIFLLPKFFINSLERLFADFWWGGKEKLVELEKVVFE